jgi:hypothetical protein
MGRPEPSVHRAIRRVLSAPEASDSRRRRGLTEAFSWIFGARATTVPSRARLTFSGKRSNRTRNRTGKPGSSVQWTPRASPTATASSRIPRSTRNTSTSLYTRKGGEFKTAQVGLALSFSNARDRPYRTSVPRVSGSRPLVEGGNLRLPVPLERGHGTAGWDSPRKRAPDRQRAVPLFPLRPQSALAFARGKRSHVDHVSPAQGLLSRCAHKVEAGWLGNLEPVYVWADATPVALGAIIKTRRR